MLIVGWRDTERHEQLIQRLERALAVYPHDPSLLRALSSLHARAGRHERALDYLLRLGRQFQHPRYSEEAGQWHLRGLKREWMSPVLGESGAVIHRPGSTTIRRFGSHYYSYHPYAPGNDSVFDWSIDMATTLIALDRPEIALQQLRIAYHSYWAAAEDLEFFSNQSRAEWHRTRSLERWHQWRRVGELIEHLSAGDPSLKDAMAHYGSSAPMADRFGG